jgi:signal transduction histidine kinase
VPGSAQTSTVVRIFRNWSPAILTAIGYYAGTVLGFEFTPQGQPNSAFWPPNAILLAGFLLVPRRLWWTLLVLALPAHMGAQMRSGIPLWTAIAWFSTNSSEALVGAFWITQFIRPTRLFESARGVLIFIGFGVLIAPFATSFLDAAAVVLTGWGHGYAPIGAERFWTNSLAELTIVPSILLVGSNLASWIRNRTLARFVEAAMLGVAAVAFTVWVFDYSYRELPSTPLLVYLPLILLLWATIRFGPAGVSLCALIIVPTSIWHIIKGQEPFPYASLSHNVLWFQILVCIVVVPLLFWAATLTEARTIQESLRRVAGSLINTQEKERHRIARELHDGLAQQLALGVVRLQTLIERSSDSVKFDLEHVAQDLAAISTTTQEISHGLYPAQLEYLGLQKSLTKLCDDVRQNKIEIQLSVKDIPRELSPEASLCLYRIAQEALRNVVRHSHADNVSVELRAENGWLRLEISDDGVGFDAGSNVAGIGLTSMRERVRSVHGLIEIMSSPEIGTRIRVRIPIRGLRQEILDVA